MLLMFILINFLLIMLLNLNYYLIFDMSKLINLSLEFDINFYNLTFSIVVMFISINVIIYSKYYFHFHMFLSFKINLLIFIFSMILLINGNSLIIILIGWDGLGVSSFYLIYYYSNFESSISSFITFLFNRLGDSFMMIFFSLIMLNFSSINIFNMNKLLFFILFLGLITKSSQIPFGVWLPMAMSAPTPISSLVHSSTLVTAGIYILMKINILFFLFDISFIIMMFSIMTFLLGGMFAFSIMDFKKAIAFSTLSQLGFIMFSLIMGNFIISFFHLIFHAFFKSSLFMNLGFFMFKNYSIQDSRMISFMMKNKIMNFMFIISCMNLMGMIFTSGFITKDMILIFFFNNSFKYLILMMFYLSCLFSMSYSLKFIFLMMNKNMKFLKLMMNNKFSIFFSGIILTSIIILLFPLMLLDLIMMNMEMFLNMKLKILFYMMIFMSLLKIKILIKFYLNLMMFSSMIMIIETIMNMMNLIFNKLKMLFIFIMNLDYFQSNIMFFLFNKMMNINLIKMLFLLNLNLLILMIFI